MALEAFDDGGVGHAAALTHRLQPVAAAALLQRVDHRRHDSCAAGAQRVADRDGTAVDVRLGQIGAGVVSPGQCRIRGAMPEKSLRTPSDVSAGCVVVCKLHPDRISSLRFGNHKPTPAVPNGILFGRKKLAVVDELVTGSKVAGRHQFVRLRKLSVGWANRS